MGLSRRSDPFALLNLGHLLFHTNTDQLEFHFELIINLSESPDIVLVIETLKHGKGLLRASTKLLIWRLVIHGTTTPCHRVSGKQSLRLDVVLDDV